MRQAAYSAIRHSLANLPANNAVLLSQRRTMFIPNTVSTGMRWMISGHFRGRGMKRSDQLHGTFDDGFNVGGWQNTTAHYGFHGGPRRLPDIDDPRPPIVGWRCIVGMVDHDGTLPILPLEFPVSGGRKLLAGLYCDFKELYNQHQPCYIMYGGGVWCPFGSAGTWIHPEATVCGQCWFSHPNWIYAKAVLRGDLNGLQVRSFSHVREGAVLTTDGHPRNNNKPGRVSRLNEGVLYVGVYCMIGPNAVIDSAWIGDYCDVGEGAMVGSGAVMERFSSIEPGTVLLANQRVPRFEIWGGNPARRVGYRCKQMHTWTTRMEQEAVHVAMLQAYERPGYYVDALWNVTCQYSSQRLEEALSIKLEQCYGRVPEKAAEYISKFTPDIPLWEMFKNMSRMIVRPGLKRAYGWTVDAKKSRWYDHY